MGSPERKRAASGKPRKGRNSLKGEKADRPEREPAGQPQPVVDTWIKLGYEIVRWVVPHRGHTVNLILLLTVPACVLAAVLGIVMLVLVPHPPLALGALASGLGVYGVSRVRVRRLVRRAAAPLERSAPADDPEGSEGPATLPPT